MKKILTKTFITCNMENSWQYTLGKISGQVLNACLGCKKYKVKYTYIRNCMLASNIEYVIEAP